VVHRHKIPRGAMTGAITRAMDCWMQSIMWPPRSMNPLAIQ
jgi:hypothetical protein